MIETLPPLTPDPLRSARTVARCQKQLARRRRRLEPGVVRPGTRYLALERALVGVFCVIYLSGIALVAIEVLGG